MIAGLTGRPFLRTSSIGAVGLAWLASGQAPAFARALTGQLKVG